MKKCTVKKTIVSWGRGYGSAHFDKEEWGVFLEPFGILLRTFKTEAEAEAFKKTREAE